MNQNSIEWIAQKFTEANAMVNTISVGLEVISFSHLDRTLFVTKMRGYIH